jgi:cell wall assembly regulator SMI1
MTIEDALRALAKDGDPPVRADESPEQLRAIAEIERAIDVKLDPVSRRYLAFVPREPSGQWETPHWMQWSYWWGLTLREMLAQRKVTLGLGDDDGITPDHGVRAKWFHDKWLPIAEDGGGNFVCIDLDPAPGGTAGQIVEFRHDDSARPRLAASLLEYLTHLEDEDEEDDDEEDDEPQLPLLIARFFVDGQAQPAKVSVFQGENPEPVAQASSPAELRLPKGDYSVRFEFEGRAHWRRNIHVWSKQEIDFHW